jgi:hypothetical protein
MSLVTVVHIVFDPADDPHGFARRHIGREVGRGISQSDIVRDAWVHRHHPVPNAITSTAFRAPPFTATEIYFDPAVVGGASEKEVIEALIKAGQR